MTDSKLSEEKQRKIIAEFARINKARVESGQAPLKISNKKLTKAKSSMGKQDLDNKGKRLSL